MKIRKGYLPKESIFPFMGIDTLTPSTQVDPHYSPDLLNVAVTKGILQKRKGYTTLGDTMNASGDPENVLGVIEYEDLDGVKTLLAFTDKRQYAYDSAGDQWEDITYDDGGGPVEWTGDETNQLDMVVVSGLDDTDTFVKWVIVTNGKDQPRYWDGTGNMKLYAPTGITDFLTCKTLASFYDHVVLGNVTLTTSATFPSTVYWSNAQSLVDFTGGGTSTSGVAIITDTQGPIQRLLPLGDRLMIYADNTVHNVTYVAGTIIFSFEKIMHETRLLGPRTIVSLGAYHVFMSQENVTLFDGSRLYRLIGDRIYREFRDELFASKREFAHSFHDVAKQQVYFFYPVNALQSQAYVLEYDLSDFSTSKWTKIKYNNRATCLGFLTRDVNLTWDSVFLDGVKWNELNLTWSQGSTKGSFPVRVFGSNNGRVYLADDSLSDDAGEAFTATWDSADFTVPQEFQSSYARWIEIEFDVSGYEIDVWLSTNEGQTYTFIEKLNLTNAWTKRTVFIDVSSPTLRVRLVNNCASSPFYVRWMRVWLRPGGPS